ncbi:MAG: hypothetical protein AAF609_22845 [Cyanobacteria bacterium P01_C01_bin.120]
MKEFMQVFGWANAAVFIVIAIAVLQALPVWILWNALVPNLLELPQLSFFDAITLSILCACLFKSGGGSAKK